MVGGEDDEASVTVTGGRGDLVGRVADGPHVVGLDPGCVDAPPGLRQDRLQLGGLDEGDHLGALVQVAEVLRAFGIEQHLEDRENGERIARRFCFLDRVVEGRPAPSESSYPIRMVPAMRRGSQFGTVAAQNRRDRAERERPS